MHSRNVTVPPTAQVEFVVLNASEHLSLDLFGAEQPRERIHFALPGQFFASMYGFYFYSAKFDQPLRNLGLNRCGGLQPRFFSALVCTYM